MSKKELQEIIVHEDKCTGCRICQLICSSKYEKKFVPMKAFIQIQDFYQLSPIIYFTEKCTMCGQCVLHCLYGALEIKESAS
ncbi:MAG: 4Fe-4S binding protein [Candidatus Thorarchaeota archaeon]